MLVQEQDYLKHDAFLQHFGVPGMKWGVRKNRNVVNARNAMLRAKNAKKIASKNAWNSYSQAYNDSQKHAISQNFGKGKKANDILWDRVNKDIDTENKARKAYKDAKKAYKEAKKTAKVEYKAKYKKALADNKDALKKNKEKYLSTGDKDKYKKIKKKLKQDRYYIKNIGV